METREDYNFCRGQMAPDEFVLWTGKPEIKGNLFTTEDIPLTLFYALWTGFAVFWFVSAAKYGGLFSIFGIPFVFVGCYLLFGRFIHKAYLRRRTTYVITNRRVYRKRGQKIDNLPATQNPGYETIIHRNGNATIRFHLISDDYRSAPKFNGRQFTRRYELENLLDADRVQQALARMGTNE